MKCGAWLVSGALFWTAWASAEGQGAPLSPKDRFLKEYPAAVARLEARYSSAEGAGRLARTMGKAKKVAVENVKFTRLGKKLALEVSTPAAGNDPAVVQVYGRNESYSFALANSGRDGAFVVKALDFDVEPTASRQFGLYLTSPHRLFDMPLSKLIAAGEFTILDAKNVEYDEKPCVQISFRHRYHPADKPSTTTVREGWIKLAPTEGWAMKAYEYSEAIDGRPPFLVEGTIRYREEGADVVPTSVSIVFPGREMSFEFDNLRLLSANSPGIDEGRFMLASYGLPELRAPTPRSSGALAPVLVAGSVFALGLSLFVRSRRRARAAE